MAPNWKPAFSPRPPAAPNWNVNNDDESRDLFDLDELDLSYQGSTYYFLLIWDNGESTYASLCIFPANSSVSTVTYEKKSDLLDDPGWK